MSIVKLSNSLIRAINSVNQSIAYDIDFCGERSSKKRALILAETCIDAGRIETAGYPEADAELKGLIEIHGYQVVLREVANHVSEA